MQGDILREANVMGLSWQHAEKMCETVNQTHIADSSNHMVGYTLETPPTGRQSPNQSHKCDWWFLLKPQRITIIVTKIIAIISKITVLFKWAGDVQSDTWITFFFLSVNK